ncbi:hypothetical protein BDSB_12940 [Burkholderia dolosa PC543]|nr:hypothetical protein BDSB_12940 [Burkholderia dolosa PC543]
MPRSRSVSDADPGSAFASLRIDGTSVRIVGMLTIVRRSATTIRTR